jgi:hypothetical protein
MSLIAFTVATTILPLIVGGASVDPSQTFWAPEIACIPPYRSFASAVITWILMVVFNVFGVVMTGTDALCTSVQRGAPS